MSQVNFFQRLILKFFEDQSRFLGVSRSVFCFKIRILIFLDEAEILTQHENRSTERLRAHAQFFNSFERERGSNSDIYAPAI